MRCIMAAYGKVFEGLARKALATMGWPLMYSRSGNADIVAVYVFNAFWTAGTCMAVVRVTRTPPLASTDAMSADASRTCRAGASNCARASALDSWLRTIRSERGNATPP